ncbi:MAG TPA: mucoidy inhibitor MuiA family protein [Anaerolineae bacterium]|nr:mucoidy inhibitor MuiA family protein [Anaerolineae bacterium]
MPDLSMHIVEVTVYPDRARVTRRGSTTLEPGLHQLSIADLPLALDTASVRAGGKFRPSAASGSARLLGVDVRRTYYQDTPVAMVKELEDQILALEDADRVLADKAEALAVQEAFARSVAEKAGEQLARGIAFSRTDVAQGSALMGFVAQEMTRTQNDRREIGIQRRDLARQLEQLRNQLRMLQGSRGRERYTATVEVEVTAVGELTVDLVYVVTSAGWLPLYDMRLDPSLRAGFGEVELAYLGQVTQRSGEDWNSVTLVLSTARPALATVLPELKPWYVSVYEPPVVHPVAKGVLRVAEAPIAPAAVVPQPAAEFAVAEPVALEAVTAGVESAGASVTFRLHQQATVPADGEPHKVTVATARLEPKLDYVTAPRLAEFAYRRAKVKNGDLMLLPGAASIFVEGDFIGSAPLKLTAPGEEFEAYFGVDDRVYVKRELKAREVDKKLLQEKRRLHYGYEIEVRNLRPGRIDLEIHDQMPVSRHESIKVRLESVDPKPAEQSEMNELTWKLSLEAGAKQLVRFDFSVEHPRDLQVAGLP